MRTERFWYLAAAALVVMGASDLLRRSATGTIATLLLVIEVCAIVLGVAAIFAWARQVQKTKKSGDLEAGD